MLELVDVHSFVRIADLRSISAAARSLGLPKSTVSRSLARLEEALRAVLIERSSRHLRLTDAGHLFYPHAQKILIDVNQAEAMLSSVVGKPQGVLRVSAPYAFSCDFLAPMLPGFLARYPDIELDLDVVDRRIDMMVEERDVVIRIGPLADSDLVARRLTAIALIPCASPAYVKERGHPRTAVELDGHDLLGRVERLLEWAGEQTTEDIGHIQVHRRAKILDPSSLRIVLEGGAGIGLLPDFMVKPAIATGKLVPVLETLKPYSVDVHALYPSHRGLSAKVRVFIDALVVYLQWVSDESA